MNDEETEKVQSHIGREKEAPRQSVMAGHSRWRLIKLEGMSHICSEDKYFKEDAELWLRKVRRTKMHIQIMTKNMNCDNVKEFHASFATFLCFLPVFVYYRVPSCILMDLKILI